MSTNKTPNTKDIIDSQKLVIDTFMGFRNELLTHYGAIEHTTKLDSSPVTDLDIKIESNLKDKLNKEFPSFGFKGEETESSNSDSNAIWYVDPIDGTSSFIHGLPYCSNMAALVINGVVEACVIYHFASDELFTAIRGQGAFKNGKRIVVKEAELINSYVFSDAYSYINIYKYFEANKLKFYAPMGATGYFMTRFAQGSIQGVCYLRAKLKEHDIAPGVLLAEEAGGKILSLSDKPFDFSSNRFMICTNNVYKIAQESIEDITKI
jgi:myo-inositol-1(or 4)-monophosphatase